MPYTTNDCELYKESISVLKYPGRLQIRYAICRPLLGWCTTIDRDFRTVIPSDGTIAGYLPAPENAEPEQEPAHVIEEPEQVPDLASSLFGVAVQDAPEQEPEPEVTKNVMFTYKSGNVKHELRAGATLVKVGKCYYTQLGRKISAIYTDETCKRTVPERHYARLFNVSEDPTLFA